MRSAARQLQLCLQRTLEPPVAQQYSSESQPFDLQVLHWSESHPTHVLPSQQPGLPPSQARGLPPEPDELEDVLPELDDEELPPELLLLRPESRVPESAGPPPPSDATEASGSANVTSGTDPQATTSAHPAGPHVRSAEMKAIFGILVHPSRFANRFSTPKRPRRGAAFSSLRRLRRRP